MTVTVIVMTVTVMTAKAVSVTYKCCNHRNLLKVSMTDYWSNSTDSWRKTKLQGAQTN